VQNISLTLSLFTEASQQPTGYGTCKPQHEINAQNAKQFQANLTITTHSVGKQQS